MSTATQLSTATKDWLQPFFVVVPFSTIVTGFFNLSERLPLPAALAAGLGWGIVLGLVLTWVRKREVLNAWLEDAFVFLAVIGLGFAGCGGLMALVVIGGALESPSLTGETLRAMFLPTIPYYIIATAPMELLIVPGLVVLGWRAGTRRVLLTAAAALYLVFRGWSYTVFVGARTDFAALDQSDAPLSEPEVEQAYEILVDDQRWIMVLVILGIYLLAAYFPAVPRAMKRG